MPTTLVMLAVAAGAMLALFFAVLFSIRNFYVVPRADEALVKTGGREPVVSTGGGLWVIPMFHRVTHVSLKAVKIPIERTADNALPTANKIPAEIRGELIVRVSPDDPKHVVLAAQSLGAEGGSVSGRMEEIIQQQVDSLVTDALRTAAFKKSFEKLNSEKGEFADEVTQLLALDLAKLGLVLVAVTVPHLKQGEFTKDPGDVFAAEGQRNVAETVAKNRQETNKIKREADIKVQEQDVESRKRALELDRQQKELEAEQARQVAEFTATKETETKKAVLAQEQERAVASAEQKKTVETSRILQEQAIAAAQIVQDNTLTVQRAKASAESKKAEEEAARIKAEAEIARQKAVESAAIAKDQAIKVADQQRTQAISEAEIVREIAIAGKKADEAAARGSQATAEAEQRKAEETIITVKAEAEADRARRVVVIKADEQAQQQKVAADRDAYVQTRKAEGDRDAAIKQAEAVRAHAEGQANAVKATAQGRAEAMKLEAEAEASARTIRATAEFEASDKEAKAKIALAGAVLTEGKARAESERLLMEARNAVSNQVLMRDVAMKAFDQAPAMIREFMAPITKVSDVRVLQINGLGGGGEDGANLPGTIMGAGLAAAGALPMIKEAMRSMTENPDVKEITEIMGGVARNTLRDAASAIRESTAATEVIPPSTQA